MTYYCGIGPRLAEARGVLAREPQIVCDGCGVRICLGGVPPNWFLNKKPKPGWSLVRTEHDDGRITRDDRCPKCRTKQHARAAKKARER